MSDFSESLSREISLELNKLFTKATRRQLKLAGKPFNRIVELYKDNVTSLPARADLNSRIAFTMRAGVLQAYKDNVLAVRTAPAYPRKYRLSGALLTVLEGDSFIVGTAEDIEFNFSTLNAAAKHWGRLNFGASPGIGYNEASRGFPARSGRIQFGKNQGFSFVIPGEISPGFTVPAAPAFSGHFESGGQFFLGKPGGRASTGQFQKKGDITLYRRAPSRGIAPRHFMDAGLVALQQNFSTFYREYFEDAVRKTKAQEL